MEIEEIENLYAQEISKANEYYINGLKKKEKKEILEKDYKNKLKIASEKYDKNIRKFLKNNKKQKQKKKAKKDKSEHFIAKKGKYERSFFQNLKIKLKISLFNLKIKSKQIKEKLIPVSLSYFLMKRRVIIKHDFINLKNKISYIYHRLTRKITAKIQAIKEYLKEKFIKLKEKIKVLKEKFQNMIKKIKEKLKKKEKPKETEQNQTPAAVPEASTEVKTENKQV